ncbi:MAG: hypothetical protein KatS3mg060_2141 [Dehalococcoidia bacterium]|nr:MAG: hypothetical protein KatS3mg060_2141 [Dehalococcoidia bacterium]
MARIVDTSTMAWQNGGEVIKAMAPEWRANLGPAEQVAETYAKYDQKTLRLDPATTRRLDLIRLAPGYRDLTYAYHDSVEECFCLGGSCWLGGEGTIHEWGYFWRPPGWVHTAATEEGFVALLGIQGECDESGPASRRVRPESEAGRCVTTDDPDAALGPRGFVKMLDSRLVPWQPGPVFARCEGPLDGFDLERVAFKVLSKNPWTGAQSLLLRLAPGYRQARPGRHTAGFEAFVITGSARLGETPLPAGSYFERTAGAEEPPLASEEGAILFAKADGWLDFR